MPAGFKSKWLLSTFNSLLRYAAIGPISAHIFCTAKRCIVVHSRPRTIQRHYVTLSVRRQDPPWLHCCSKWGTQGRVHNVQSFGNSLCSCRVEVLDHCEDGPHLLQSLACRLWAPLSLRPFGPQRHISLLPSPS